MKCKRKRKFRTSCTYKIVDKIWIKLQVWIIFYRILHLIPHNFCIKHFLFRHTERWENIHRKWRKFLPLEWCLCFCVHAAYIWIDSSQDRLAHTLAPGYNFKALSCEAAHLSPQFPCLSIENFLLLTYRLNK